MRVPEWARPRLLVILLFFPFPAGAVLAAVLRIVVRWALWHVPLGPLDAEVGLPLAAVLGIPLGAMLERSVKVWRGAESDYRLAFRLAPFTALAGALVGFLAGPSG